MILLPKIKLIKEIMFNYKDNLVEQNQTLNQFLNDNNVDIGEIKIDVNHYCFNYFNRSYKLSHC